MSPEAVQQMWVVTLAIFLVVLVVVAALLTMILSTARQIHAGVSAIWTAGQQVANNTVHLAMLDRTNHLGRAILASAGRIAAATDTLAVHAAACPRCPACVTGSGGGR
jgi:hypothetical protein